MFPDRGDGARERRKIGMFAKDDHQSVASKAAVMALIGRLVNDGVAELNRLTNGDIELSLRSGEVFHLNEAAITRVR
jgi:hypothetical protein